MKTSGHTSLEKYTSHTLFERVTNWLLCPSLSVSLCFFFSFQRVFFHKSSSFFVYLLLLSSYSYSLSVSLCHSLSLSLCPCYSLFHFFSTYFETHVMKSQTLNIKTWFRLGKQKPVLVSILFEIHLLSLKNWTLKLDLNRYAKTSLSRHTFWNPFVKSQTLNIETRFRSRCKKQS